MSSVGVSGAPGAVRGLGASSPLPLRPRCAAPARAVVAHGAHGGGDLRGSLREVFERLFADGHVDLASAASWVGASAPPPPPRRAASPPALVASGAHGGGDPRDPLREVFERLFADGHVDLAWAASCVGASWPPPPPPPRFAASPRALVAPHGHGGDDLRAGLRLDAPLPRLLSSRPMATEVFEWLVANGYAESVAPGVGATSPPPPPRRAAPRLTLVASDGLGGGELRDSPLLLCDAPPPSVIASDGHGGGRTPRDPLRDLFERLVADGLVHLVSPACGSPFRFCRINIGRFRASYLLNLNVLNLNAQKSEATLFISRKDMAEALYPQGQLGFHQHRPRIQELDMEGKDFNAHEEAGDLAPSITKPKLFSQPSLLLKNRKAHVCRITDLNSAIRDFDHATNDQLIGSCTSAPQFCLITDYMLHHEHEVRPLKPESVEGYVRNLTEAKNIGEKCDKQTREDNASEPDSAPNSDTESAGGFQEENLMEKFNKMLVDCVFFALPQVLIFFPRYQASEEKTEQPEQRVSLMDIIQQTDNQSNEKVFVIFFFVMFVSVWLLGLVLSLFGRGRRCTEAVSMLTLWTVGSTVAFTDYMFCKCLPEVALFTWLFRGHFVAMFVGIAYIWFTYVRVPKFPSLQLPSCQGVFARFRRWRQNPAPAVDDAKAKDELKRLLLPV